jgi:3-hydroxypropanoate dehydrogenase
VSAPVTGILARDTRFHEQLPSLYPFLPDIREALEEDLEWRDRIGVLSSNIQAGYLILAALAPGLAAGPMEGFNRAELDAEFFPEGRFKRSSS